MLGLCKKSHKNVKTDGNDRLFCNIHTPLSEFLERDAIREALSTDADPLQNSITPQLV